MENIKTMGELLQDIVEKEEKRFGLSEFLLNSNEEDRKNIEKKLVDADYNQFNEYMSLYHFISEDEVRLAIIEYYEKVMNRGCSIGEMVDLEETVYCYIQDNNLYFDD